MSPNNQAPSASSGGSLLSKATRKLSKSLPWRSRSTRRDMLPTSYIQDNESTNEMLLRSAEYQLFILQPSGMCLACSNIKLGNQYPSTHHTVSRLKDSANRGCPTCRFMMKYFLGGSEGRSAEVSIDLKQSVIRYRVPNSGGGSQAVFELFAKTGHPSTQASNFRDIQPDPLSSPALELIGNWLRNCHSNHQACTQDAEFHLPTRVIDVSGVEPCIREMDLTSAPYVALSHCWGNKPTLTSTISTLPAHKEKILFSTMPKTFQDAVTITKALGVSYLWIDSLCIVQDSLDDWLTECPKMGLYYRNSYVTISALESPDSQHGFLAPRELGDTIRLPGETAVWIRPKLKDRGKIFQSAALNYRGWALQERLMSTRVLHFTHQEMFWECQTCSARESSVVENRGATDFQSLTSSEGEDFKRALQFVGSDRFSNRDGAFAIWMRLVRQFSRRSLTYPTDKLPAISGLAAIMAANTKSKYMAGLWQDDPHGLAWFKDGPDDAISHVKEGEDESPYLAPSWSWVSLNESVTYRFNEEDRVTSTKDPILVSAEIDTRDADLFGYVSGGCITIEALVKTVQCATYSANEKVFGRIEPKHWLSGVAPFSALPIYVYGEDGTSIGTGCFDRDFDSGVVHTCKAVRIAERCYERQPYWTGDVYNPINRSGPIKQSVIYFLLVRPDERNEGVWKRVGVGLTRNIPQRENYSDPFDSLNWERLTLF